MTYIITSITARPICLAVPIIVEVVVFNDTFNNFFSYIVVVSFIGGENHRPAANHRQTLSHNVVSLTNFIT